MSNESIFLPMLTMIALTAVVWVYMYALRIPAMRRARKAAQTYTTPQSIIQLLPEAVNYPANNLKNLFELPVLFYVLCLYIHAVQAVDAVYVGAAWVFVIFRILHSVEHCLRNKVMTRFVLYSCAALALWFMLGRALIGAISVY